MAEDWASISALVQALFKMEPTDWLKLVAELDKTTKKIVPQDNTVLVTTLNGCLPLSMQKLTKLCRAS